MKITKHLIKEITNIELKEDFCFNKLGLVNTLEKNSLTFLDNKKYISELFNNNNISGVITNKDLSLLIKKDIYVIIVENPRYVFYQIFNHIDTSNYIKKQNIISNSAIIHKTSSIGDYNITIGENVLIGPNVTIYPDVIVGDNCKIRAGTVIGVESAEYKKYGDEYLHVFHAGKVIIKNNVEIGSNCVIDKGFSYRDTIIEEHTKINNLVYIAHAANIGKRCLIIGNSMICGAVTIGDDVWIGAAATISNGITIQNNTYISIGSVVTKDVNKGEKVTGNFAISHEKFINHIKSLR